MRSALGALVLGSLLLLLSPAPAFAHADVTRTSPRDGAILAKAPSLVQVTFSEAVSLEDAWLMDSTGARVPARSTVNGSLLSIAPSSPLRQGITAAGWRVASDDGHSVTGSMAFIVGKPPKASKSVALPTLPAIPATLSGSRPGPLTLTLATKAVGGEVVWTQAPSMGPLHWRLRSSGSRITATGVLPFPGTWTMRASVLHADGSILFTESTVTLDSQPTAR